MGGVRKTAAPITAALSLALAASCGVEKPLIPEGRGALRLVAVDTSGVFGVEWRGVAGATVEMSSSTFSYHERFVTDDSGLVAIDELPSGDYTVQVSMKDEAHNIILMGQAQENLVRAASAQDTVFLSFLPVSPVVINEVYYAGCNASSFYFYDQFVELYNSTDTTVYLDGYIICRSQQTTGVIDLEAEDYALAYYVYQFPGTRGVTRECPIEPKQFLVIAGDAINHHLYGSACVDLTEADYETFNAMKNDFDNTAVPNLTPVTLTGVDFMLTLTHGAICLATGDEYTFADHTTSDGVTTYVHIPLRTIVDAVEYSPDPAYKKYFTIRIDAGFGGNELGRYKIGRAHV